MNPRSGGGGAVAGCQSLCIAERDAAHNAFILHTESCLVGPRILQSDGDVVLGSMCCRMI